MLEGSNVVMRASIGPDIHTHNYVIELMKGTKDGTTMDTNLDR